jgi:hypothetical protein
MIFDSLIWVLYLCDCTVYIQTVLLTFGDSYFLHLGFVDGDSKDLRNVGITALIYAATSPSLLSYGYRRLFLWR